MLAREEIAVIESEIATLTEREKTIAKAQESRRIATEQETAAGVLETQASTLTDALSQLQTVKTDLLSKLPIKGVTIEDGDLFVDGIAFDRVNEGRKSEIAIQISELRAKDTEFPLICVDGLERLDSESWDRFVEAANKSTCQFIGARVTDGDFEISTS